ncbi:MAG: bifunctional serine/threonine-protein kinase/formylglycine-generating enzyme family protein [Polyangiaceae bacterium]
MSTDKPDSSMDDTASIAPSPARQTALTATLPDPDATASLSAASPPPRRVALPDRYDDIRQLGSGSFGEVRRVFDRRLRRTVAMKILRPESLSPALSARFLAEIRLTAGLTHPGIVPVHDYGRLRDGRLWYTMAEVRGRTFSAVIDEAYSGQKHPSGPARRRLLDIFARICEAVAYAHSESVIHRDLKPSNVMVGDLGRVLVMDWGLARKLDPPTDLPAPSSGAASPADSGTASPGDSGTASTGALADEDSLTRVGDVLGTPAYMAPEQALGDVKRHGLSTDVYALGAILYHVLTGAHPYSRGGSVRLGPPDPLPRYAGPPELLAICERAMARAPEDRYPDAGALASDIEAFVSGAQRRERALAEVEKASARLPEIAAQRARADTLRAEAQKLLENVQPFAPVSEKRPGWDREDEAESLLREATLGETQWEQAVYGALAIDPDLPEAHAALADHYHHRIALAERSRKPADAARFEVLLRAHDRGQYATFLSGMGALSLLTDPPGAQVTLYRYVTHERRLVPEKVEDLGPTPIRQRRLPHGSYLLRIAAPGRAEVAYPVLIDRGDEWDGVPPGSKEPYSIPLPLISELGKDEVYVPAGWCLTGGDAEAPESLPRQRLWMDGFVIGRFPVTNDEYLVFLNDLLATGREQEALDACPRANWRPAKIPGERLFYDRGPDGQFRLSEGDTGGALRPGEPAVWMSWYGALAYVQWLSARRGIPYRLLNELEREKAARGADGRPYPWGVGFDPTWACMVNSHAKDIVRSDVREYPLDESPYGVRGLAGNTRDFCLNVWTLGGPEAPGGRLVVEPQAAVGDDFRSSRGGAFRAVATHCLAAARHAARPGDGWNTTGVRIARSYP